MPNVCVIDGRVLPEGEASVPVLDRGFLFGDSIYEVVCTRRGVPFAFRQHMERLRASAARIRLPVPFSDEQMAHWLKEGMAAAGGGGERYLRIIVTRGTGSAPSIDPECATGPPTTLVLVRELPPEPAGLKERGVSAAIPSVLRNDPRALDPAIKSGNYLNNILGLLEARERGAEEAIFLNAARQVTEASTSNVGIARGGEVLTPPTHLGILAGVTRALLLDAATRHGLPLREAAFSVHELLEADEVFLTSTLRGVLAVTSLEGRPVADGRPGPVTRRLSAMLEEHCDAMLDGLRLWWEAVPGPRVPD